MPTIERIEHVTVLNPVPVRNSSNATYVLDSSGRKWIRKTTDACDVLAEAISTLLCKVVDVPVPDGACLLAPEEGAKPFWLSQVIEGIVHWSGARAQMLVNPQALGSILAVDAVVGNYDRHNENLLLQPTPDPASLYLFGIDFARAWVGTAEHICDAGLALPPLHSLAPDIPMDLAEPGALKCAERLSNVDDAAIIRIVRSCCKFTSEARDQDIAAALYRRCQAAGELIPSYLQAIRDSRLQAPRDIE
jgi:hypothetical protein